MIGQLPQYTTALSLNHFSDEYDVPFPPIVTSGIALSGSFQLRDGLAFFINDGVKIGMIVWNNTTGKSAMITAILGQKELSIDNDIFSSAGDSYTIFSSPNPGCFIYLGDPGSASVKVTTQGGDVVVFENLPSGAVLPVSVLRVWATDTSATLLTALW
jgi:hypothetical protein